MTEEPASLMLELLRQMRAELGDVRSNMATKADLASLQSDVAADMHSLRADVAADLHSMQADIHSTRNELSEQIVGLRRAVVEYHTSVIGHGVLISDLEARMRRVEQHLNLPSLHPA